MWPEQAKVMTLRRNMSTPEARAFWAAVKASAKSLDKLPAWVSAGFSSTERSQAVDKPEGGTPVPYDEKKFAPFNELLRRTDLDGILHIHHLRVLGDTYEELTENLDRIATAGLLLKITPSSEQDAQWSPPSEIIGYGSPVRLRDGRESAYQDDMGRVISMRNHDKDLLACVHWHRANTSSWEKVAELVLVRD